MKRSLLIIIAVFLFFPLFAQYKVIGGSGQPQLAYTNGLTEIYLLDGLAGAQISFTSSQAGDHEWYQYKQSIDDAVPIPCTQSGNVSVITGIQEGYGYYVAAPIGTGYVWIVDYSNYVTHFSGLSANQDEYSCERLILNVNADVTPIYYYTSLGVRNTLQRKFLLTYNTLEWQEDNKMFAPLQVNENLTENKVFPITLDNPPLTNTTFTLTDVFADNLGIAQAITSDEYKAIKVEVHYTYEQPDKKIDENKQNSTDSLSAPITYIFTAYANEPVAAFYNWRIFKLDKNTNQYNMIARFPEKVLQYKFENAGSYMAQLEVNNNAQTTCTDSASIKFSIGTTKMIIPNAFSPGSSIGVNDIFKVSFRSVTDFHASIYNRWGNLLFQWTDPTQGWNGMVNGKYVPTGAYFVVVEYTDSEGKRHKEGSDVNILRSKN